MGVLVKVLLGIVGIVVLAVGGLAVYLGAFFDPNEYKGLITEQARTHANLDLQIEGDIGWSVFPWLGLEIGKVSAAPSGGDRLAAVNGVKVGVKLMPLLSGNVEMSTVVLDGLDARLVRDKDGRGNWEAIGGAGGAKKPAEASADKPAAGGGELPKIEIAGLKIKDANLTWDDQQAGQKVQLRKLNLSGEQIRLGEFFPLALDFHVDVGEPAMKVDLKLKGEISADPGSESYKIRKLDVSGEAEGEPFGGKRVGFGAGGDLEADLKQQVAKLSGFFVSLANLRANIELDATKILDKPELAGDIKVQAFSAKKLLAALGQPAIETSDASALDKVAAGLKLKGAGDSYAANGLSVTLDDTNLNGSARFNTATQAVFFRLQGNAIDIDRYLPPKAEGEAGAAGGDPAPAPAPAAGGELLPVEPLRGLNNDGEFSMDSVKVAGLGIGQMALKVLAKGGNVNLTYLRGNMYEGSFNTTANIDARGKTPTLKVSEKIDKLQLGPMLRDLAQEERVAGTLNLDADFATRGNSQKAWMAGLTGPAQINLSDGKINGFNLSERVCQGLAQINKEALPAQQWVQETSIDKLSGSMQFTNGVGSNNDLIIEAGGMRVTGNGTVDLGTEALDYRTEVRVLGAQVGDNTTACSVNEKYRNVAIPMRCQGKFSDEPGKLCKLDFAALLKAEAQRRVNEKIDEKVGGKLKEKLGDQLGDDVTNKLKGLFGR